MNLIVAVDENWGIGKDNELLCRISADMKNFRAVTMGHVLVLGRKTLESFPGKKPLPKRTHIVLTANKAYEAEGVILCHSLEELPVVLADYEDERSWARKSLVNIAKAGYFSSDRTIEEYNKDIWHL